MRVGAEWGEGGSGLLILINQSFSHTMVISDCSRIIHSLQISLKGVFNYISLLIRIFTFSGNISVVAKYNKR